MRNKIVKGLIEKEPELKSTIQRFAYQLTINNPVDHGFSHEEIKSKLINVVSTLKYFCMFDEKLTCDHTHIYVVFTSRVRLSKVKKSFPCAHIEVAHGTAQQNVDYKQNEEDGKILKRQKPRFQVPTKSGGLFQGRQVLILNGRLYTE